MIDQRIPDSPYYNFRVSSIEEQKKPPGKTRRAGFTGLLLTILAVVFFVVSADREGEYLVVLDPGHGGLGIAPKEVHGDKYDPVLKKYLIYYQQGTSYKGYHESDITYRIALKAQEILQLTETSEGRKKFRAIVQKYVPDAKIVSKTIKVELLRDKGFLKSGKSVPTIGPDDGDINAPYRIYDYPDLETGIRQPGLVSRINSRNPHLVVSIHINSGYGSKPGAMSSIVSPGYRTYSRALEYIRGDSSDRARVYREFDKSVYRYWYSPDNTRSNFEWFLSDAWVYFTGYWSKKKGLEADLTRFKGIKHNYFQWAYQDENYWKGKFTVDQVLSPSLSGFKPEGLFWERELSEPEQWRREEGPEGFGGDNLYAGNEILRFIRKGLLIHGVDTKASLPVLRRPTMSAWSVPIYINAISSYLEIGFIDNPRDFARMTRHTDVYGEAVAVGVYSLLFGLEKEGETLEDEPRGKPLDLFRYENHSDGNYFKKVSKSLFSLF